MRTFKSLQVSRQHWINSKRIPKDIKIKIDEIYFNEYNRKYKTPEEMYQEIIHLEIGRCEICNSRIYVGFNCPNILKNNKLPRNPNDEQILHYNNWTKNVKKGAQERDQTYLIERNKTDEMRESSRKVGLKTGSKNIKKAHQKYDKIIPCNKCDDINCKVRNNYPLNTILIGVGCLTKHNSSDKMRKVTSERNKNNWANDVEYRKRISQNLGIYLGKKYNKIINNENKILTNFFIDNILNINYFKNKNYNIIGIYGFYINHNDYNNNNKNIKRLIYVGQSIDIFRRIKEHFVNIFNFPQWWGIQNQENDILEIQLLKECDKSKLDYYETKYINELHPWSQDIDYGAKGNNIIPLEQREKLEWLDI